MAAKEVLYTEDFCILGRLGKGKFGEVVLIEHRITRDQFARKKVYLKTADDVRQAMNEVTVMKQIQHEHIVQYVSAITNNEKMYIFMEYCPCGNLREFIVSIAEPQIPEELIMCWLYQMVLAVECLHIKRILHRDIKTENIFLSKRGDIKLGDLGVSRILKDNESLISTFAGTPYYMSPEILSCHGYNEKTDIWSLGCVIYELATTDRAYYAHNLQLITNQVRRGKPPKIPKFYSQSLVELHSKMLSKDSNKRLSATEIIGEIPSKYIQDKIKPTQFLRDLTSPSVREGGVMPTENIEKVKELSGPFRVPIDSLTDGSSLGASTISSTQTSGSSTNGSSQTWSSSTNGSSQTLSSSTGSTSQTWSSSTSSSSHTISGLDTILARPTSKTERKKSKTDKQMPDFETASLDNVSISLAETVSSITSVLSISQESPRTTSPTDIEKRRKLITGIIRQLQEICATGIGEDILRQVYERIESADTSKSLEIGLKDLLKEKYAIYYQYIMYIQIFEAINSSIY